MKTNRFTQPFTPNWSRKAGNNRRLTHRVEPDGRHCVAYTLHGREVASLKWMPGAGGARTGRRTLTLDDCGFATRTTFRAMQEFMDGYGINLIWPSAKRLTLPDGDTAVWPGSTEAELEGNEIKGERGNFEVRGTKLHYTYLGTAMTPFDLAAEHIVGTPHNSREDWRDKLRDAPVKGLVIPLTWETRAHILAARKPETRETRLMTAVLLDEAEIVSWLR